MIMDPNKALEDLRSAIATLRKAAEGDSNDAEIEAGHAVADAVEALDQWLSRGGFVPDAWEGSRPDAWNVKHEGIVSAYITTALWAGGFMAEDLAPELKEQVVSDIRQFLDLCKGRHGDLLRDLDDETIGHNLWLTRNGHGEGFWSRGFGSTGDVLTELAHSLGEQCWEVSGDRVVKM